DGTTWPTVICLGEILIDLVALEPDLAVGDAITFHRSPGGAPANVAVALARLGSDAAFIGKLGGDPFGESLRQMLVRERVDLRGVVLAPSARTALAFVGSDASGGRSFVFYHAGMADTLLTDEEVNRELISQARIFHFGSGTLVAEPGHSATLTAANLAREQRCLVSFDPNLRLELWRSPEAARRTIEHA